MGFVVFHFTLVVLLASVLTSAMSLSAYLVSRKRMLFLASLGFLFYFFDCAWVFQDDLAARIFENGIDESYMFIRSCASILSSGGFITSFWLVVCDYFGEHRRAFLVVPTIVFVVASLLVLVLIPESNLQRFVFYTLRFVYLVWILLFCAWRFFITKDERDRARQLRSLPLYITHCILGPGIVVFDYFTILANDALPWQMASDSFGIERNYVENILLLIVAFMVIRESSRMLALRFERPIMQNADSRDEFINQNLRFYGRRYALSEREQEVLLYILQGYDNQKIATAMTIALSTVKVHVHNILQKTGQANRSDLMRDFWKS